MEIDSRKISRYLGLLDGLLAGILADGVVNDLEIAYLEYWLDTIEPYKKLFPFSLLDREVSRITADGVIDEEERRQIRGLLETFCYQNDAPKSENSLDDLLLDIPLNQELTFVELAPLQSWIARTHAQWTNSQALVNLLEQLAHVFEDMVFTKEEYTRLRNLSDKFNF